MATIIRTLRPIESHGCSFPSPGTLAAVPDTAASSLIAAGLAEALESEVSSSLYVANSVLAATADNSPAPVTLAEGTLLGRATGGNVAALTLAQVLGMSTGTPSATLGPELGTGSGLSQTVTTVVGQTYQVGGSGVTAITLGGASLVVSSGFSSFVATGTSSVLVGTGTGDLSVRLVTLGSRTATVTLDGAEVRRHATQSCLAIGTAAQRSLTTGSSNVAVGHAAQYSLTSGSSNTASGYAAQYSLTTGASNTAVGYAAQYSLTTGAYNVAVGHAAQSSLTSGSSNTASGYAAQSSLTTGSSNVAVGHAAQSSLTSGSYNVASGYEAQSSPKGDAARATTTASYQTALGVQSGQYAAATGDKGVSLGYRSLAHTGAVAAGADSEAQGVNSIAIGIGAVAAADNTIQLGATGTAYTLSFGNAGRVIGLTELKSIVAAAADFAALKTAIAALS